MPPSVKEFSGSWWVEVCNRIIGAAVFLDDATAECLHWDGGLFNLLSEGAVSVKSLSPFECAKKEHKKAVFITQTTHHELLTIHEIIRNSDFTHCYLISCMPLDVVNTELYGDKTPDNAAKKLEEMLTKWIAKDQCLVEVVHIPIFTISPTNVVFLTPPHHNVYPTFHGELLPDPAKPLDLMALNTAERLQIRRLAGSLNSMMNSMNFKEDVFYMGAYSSLVAGILEYSPVCSARRKNCVQPCSLIIVDRTLDLCGVTSHASESVLDKAMAVLPKFPGHCTEVAVDMTLLCKAKVLDADRIGLMPGCLFNGNDKSSVQTYDHMINKSQKEVMVDLYNQLSRLDVQKSPGPKTLDKVTPQSLEKIVAACKGNNELIIHNVGLLQQALGLIQMLKSPLRAEIDLLANLETQAAQSLAASKESTSVLHQITQLIRTRKERKLSVRNLLALIVHVYSLKGTDITFSESHENGLCKALSEAMFEDNQPLVNVEETVTLESCTKSAKGVLLRLKNIAVTRKGLQKYKTVLRPCESGVGHEYRGVVQQLVDDLVDSGRPKIPDLHRNVEGFRDLLKASFNLLTKKKTVKHPLENQTVILFIIGGTTAEECKRLHRSIITSGVDNTIYIGSTKFVAPADAMRDALLAI